MTSKVFDLREWRVSIVGAIKIVLVSAAALLAFGTLGADVKSNRRDIERNAQRLNLLEEKLDQRFDRLQDRIDDRFDALSEQLKPGR